jgi:hypothetical protein
MIWQLFDQIGKRFGGIIMALEKEFKFYLSHQNEFVEKYTGKYVVIKEHEFLGAFSSEVEAIQVTMRNYPLGTFLVIHCTPGTDSYTQTFHSRVSFE